MRLVDADKLAEDIYRAWTLWEKKGEDCYLFAEVITPMLIGQPTVDPIRHGRWIEPNDKGVISYDKHAYAECSVCHIAEYLAREKRYCPNCGAKMDEVTE